MELQTIVPELLVEDLERAVEFYVRVLDFEVSARMPQSGTPKLAELVNGSARLMLLSKEFMRSQVPNLPPSIASGASVLMVPINSRGVVRDLYRALETEVKILLPLREVGQGSVEFAFFDPDGNLIVMFGQ